MVQYVGSDGKEQPLKDYVTSLRERATNSERRLNGILISRYQYSKSNQNLPKKNVRNQVICGWYILDFLLISKCLVIEVDGSSHDNRTEYDAKRDSFIESCGLSVLRVSNEEVFKEKSSVLEKIDGFPNFPDGRVLVKRALQMAYEKRVAAQQTILEANGLMIHPNKRSITTVDHVEEIMKQNKRREQYY